MGCEIQFLQRKIGSSRTIIMTSDTVLIEKGALRRSTRSARGWRDGSAGGWRLWPGRLPVTENRGHDHHRTNE